MWPFKKKASVPAEEPKRRLTPAVFENVLVPQHDALQQVVSRSPLGSSEKEASNKHGALRLAAFSERLWDDSLDPEADWDTRPFQAVDDPPRRGQA
jgi:hypothetical protein